MTAKQDKTRQNNTRQRPSYRDWTRHPIGFFFQRQFPSDSHQFFYLILLSASLHVQLLLIIGYVNSWSHLNRIFLQGSNSLRFSIMIIEMHQHSVHSLKPVAIAWTMCASEKADWISVFTVGSHLTRLNKCVPPACTMFYITCSIDKLRMSLSSLTNHLSILVTSFASFLILQCT